LFNDLNNFKYKYAPILALSPAEMVALEELPDKDKDIILPIIPLKGWVGSQKLENSIPRIEKAIGDRFWVADIDASFITDNKEKELMGEDLREVFKEIEALLSPQDGYENWYQYIKNFKKAIPVVQLTAPDQLISQINKLKSLNNGLVVKFTLENINSDYYLDVLKSMSKLNIDDVFIVFDYGQISREVLTRAAIISSIIQKAHLILPTAIIAISCSSFPSSFSGYNSSEHSIYERLLFNTISKACAGIKMIYSDRGSARADKIGVGGGIPSPRIDYPRENEWMFIREGFDDPKLPVTDEKEGLYSKISKEIMAKDYWNPDLHVWGTQAIEHTSKADQLAINLISKKAGNKKIDKLFINSPPKATAVRINIHMHQQLHYGAPADLIDTDEEWED
jgi:hypothetical protein